MVVNNEKDSIYIGSSNIHGQIIFLALRMQYYQLHLLDASERMEQWI